MRSVAFATWNSFHPTQGEASHVVNEPGTSECRAVAPAKPFAFRVVDEMKSYVGESEALDVAWQAAVDEQVLQKVLPKLTGADPAVRFALEALLALADENGLDLTYRKAKRMLDDYDRDGFTSYF